MFLFYVTFSFKTLFVFYTSSKEIRLANGQLNINSFVWRLWKYMHWNVVCCK